MIKCIKIWFLLAGLLLSNNILQAQILSFHHGEIEFYTASIMTDIEAVTENADVKFDIQTGNIEVTVNIKSFVFEFETMQKHFNEKYMESDKFPQATFKGKTEQVISDFTGEIEIVASGKMTIHGVTKEIQVKAKISKAEGYTLVKFKMPVIFKDFNVDDPSILTKSVAKDILVKGIIYLK